MLTESTTHRLSLTEQSYDSIKLGNEDARKSKFGTMRLMINMQILITQLCPVSVISVKCPFELHVKINGYLDLYDDNIGVCLLS